MQKSSISSLCRSNLTIGSTGNAIGPHLEPIDAKIVKKVLKASRPTNLEEGSRQRTYSAVTSIYHHDANPIDDGAIETGDPT